MTGAIGVFTVILLTDAAREIYDQAKDYFAPFEEAGLIAFCPWNQSPDAVGLRGALPELPDIIQGKSAWRAVVVDHPRRGPDGGRDAENPFDFAGNDDVGLTLTDSEHALIRIGHVLLGYPHLSARSFEPYLQYEDADTGHAVAGAPQELLRAHYDRLGEQPAFSWEVPRSESEWFALATSEFGVIHNNVRRLFREVEQSDEDRTAHAALTARYQMKEVRPSEVVFIATRADVEEDEKAVLARAWRTGTEQNASRFVERNDYPPMSRFAVYELLEEENSGYAQDLLRFWLSVLTIAINQLPPGSFQSDRLYRLAVEFGTDGLSEMLNTHLSSLAMVRDHLDRLIRTPLRPPEVFVQDLLAPVETAVVFDDLGGAELYAQTHGYGLASDRPRREITRWREDVGEAAAEAKLFLRRPRRAVARAVASTRELAALQEPALTLSDIERDELDEELTRRLRPLVVPATAELLDRHRLQRVIDREDRSVTRYMLQRMTGRTIAVALGAVAGIWGATLAPYLIQAGRRGAEVFVDAALVSVLILAIIAGTTMGMLLLFRSRLRHRIRQFNAGIDEEVADVRTGASRFAEFLSRFATYRRGAARLRDAGRARDAQSDRLRRMRFLRQEVGEKIDQEKGIVLGLGAPVNVHRTSRGLVDFDPDDDDSVRRLYRFPTGETEIEFNDSGDRIRAPYDFITGVALHRLSVFEPADRSGAAPVRGDELP